MTELLALLTAAFVFYALYEVYATVSQSGDGLDKGGQDTSVVSEPLTHAQPIKSAETSPRPTEQSQGVSSPAAATGDAEKVIHLRNPSTGEVSPIPSNYRFAKKWIKEALVSEGLLTKVYKNSELNEALNLKTKEAIEKFKHLEKYHD